MQDIQDNQVQENTNKKKIMVETRFSAPVQNGPGAHPASYKMGTGSLSRRYSSGGVALTTHLRLALRLKKE